MHQKRTCLSQNFHTQLLRCSQGAILSKDKLLVAAAFTLVVAHVLHNAQTGHGEAIEHCDSTPGIQQGNVLQQVGYLFMEIFWPSLISRSKA